MSFIVQPVINARQPTQNTLIDWDNPVTKGLISVVSGGNNGRDYISNIEPTLNGSTASFGAMWPRGRGLGFTSSGYMSYSNSDQLLFANGYTCLVIARTTSLASQSGMMTKYDFSTGQIVPMTFFVRSSGELALWRNVSGNNGTIGTTTTPGGTTGLSVISTNTDFIASVDAGDLVHGTINLYLNGSLRDSGFTFGPSGSNVALQDGTTTIFGVGASNGGGSTWQGPIYLAVAWNRRLSGGEHLALHRNPWQIFMSPGGQRRYWLATDNSTGTGSAAFTFGVLAVGAAVKDTVGSSTVTFTATGVSNTNAQGVGSATVTFTPSGVGASNAQTVGTTSFTFTATGEGAAATSGQGTGTADVIFSASAVGQSTANSVGTGSFTFTATGVGSTPAATGTASFSFTAAGVGSSGGTVSGTGTASFSFSATGFSQDFVYPARLTLQDFNVTELLINSSEITSVELTDELVTELTYSDI